MRPPKTGKLRLSKHALARMSERAIKKDYIQNAVDYGEVKYFPIWYDKNTGSRKKNIKEYYLEIPDRGKLVVVIGADYGLVITVYFDIPSL
jgi:hypothetical protein